MSPFHATWNSDRESWPAENSFHVAISTSLQRKHLGGAEGREGGKDGGRKDKKE